MLIYGKNAIREAIISEKTFNKLLIDRNQKDKTSQEIIDLAKKNNVKINFVDRKVLESKLQNTRNEKIAYQGMIGEIVEFEYADLEEVFEVAENKGQDPFILVLDGVEDPHNLGAIIRTAEGAGVHGVIIPEHRACAVNDTVLKTSAGAVSNVKIVRVVNINNTVDQLKKRGVWVYACELGGEEMWKTNLKGPIAIVMGSEGFGVSKLTKEKCDAVFTIPMYGQINSLNVSVATAISVYEVLRQRN